MSTFLTGPELQATIQNMMEMGFEREQVMKALRASYNNPDRAVEYLFSVRHLQYCCGIFLKVTYVLQGIPAHLEEEHAPAPAPAPAQAPAAGGAPAPAPQAAAPAAPQAQPGQPQNLFQVCLHVFIMVFDTDEVSSLLSNNNRVNLRASALLLLRRVVLI